MIPALQDLTNHFNLLKLTVTIQFQQESQLSSFKGSILHGWLGHALKIADEHAFFICYGNHDNQQPKPYIICPNEDHKTHWKPGELYEFEISLFGKAIELADALLSALRIGESLGLGKQRSSFKVISIASHTPNGYKAGYHPFNLAQILTSLTGDLPLEQEVELAVTFTTPTRLKQQGQICTTIPDLDFLINHILRRLTLLSRFWVIDSPVLFNALYTYRSSINQHQTKNYCYFEDWQRFSKKNNEYLPFGGLKGQISFYGNIAHLIPLLHIGTLLHIGGKTTFGLGKYHLIT